MRPFIGILDPSARQLHDEHKSGGNQPANISMINRRYQLRTIPKSSLQKNSMCLEAQGSLCDLDRGKPYQRLTYGAAALPPSQPRRGAMMCLLGASECGNTER